jgi:hypothetical protein
MKNDGKYFEKKTHHILSRLNPSKDVMPDVRIVGKLSESSRQLDVILRDPGEYDFIAFECKDEKVPIGTPTIEGYHTKLMDVGAKHGAIVSNSPFSRGARRMAVRLKIDLLHLVDTGDEAIKTKLLAPSGVVHERVKIWHLAFSQKPLEGFPFTTPDYSKVVVRGPDGVSKKIKQLACEFWDELGESVTNGTVIKEFHDLILEVNSKRIELPVLKITLELDFEYRYGSMDITQSEGIYNVRDGTYQTDSLAVGPFGYEIFKSWTLTTKDEMDKMNLSAIMHTRTDLMSGNPITKLI